MRILLLIVLVACVACEAAAALAQEDAERPATRGLLKRGLLKTKQTTTTTPAPQEDTEYEEDYAEGEGEPQEPSTEAPPSSTEGKKLVGGGVRPFRSNTDLLEALKRRRAQAAEAKLHGHSNVAAAPTQETLADAAVSPAKSSYSKKRFNSVPKESHNEEAPAPAKPSRVRFGRPGAKSVQEEPEEQEESAPAPARTGRAFPRRGN